MWSSKQVAENEGGLLLFFFNLLSVISLPWFTLIEMSLCHPSQFYSVQGASSFILLCCQYFLQYQYHKGGIAVMIRVSISLSKISKCILRHTCTYTVNVMPLGRAVLKGIADLGV